jgi:large subunit ribosomal protein L25
VTISVDDIELRLRIQAGRFLTRLRHRSRGREAPRDSRDFHLDPVRDFPLHVDFMRLGEGATIRVSIPLHPERGSGAGLKRGGTVNIVTHTIDLECSVDNIRNISKPTSAAWKSATRCICPISSCLPA